MAPGEMRADNRAFHVEAREDKKYKGCMRFWVTGIGKQLSFSWNVAEETAEFVRATSISQSQLLRSQTLGDAQVRVRINLVDSSVSDARELALLLLQDERIKRKVPVQAPPAVTETAGRGPSPGQGRYPPSVKQRLGETRFHMTLGRKSQFNSCRHLEYQGL